MSKSIFDNINRIQTGTYIFRFSLLGFLVVFLGVIALLIKINFFPASKMNGYVVFIILNLLLSIILLISSRYIIKNDTRFALLFDKASGQVKLFWLGGFTIIVAIIYELLKAMLS